MPPMRLLSIAGGYCANHPRPRVRRPRRVLVTADAWLPIQRVVLRSSFWPFRHSRCSFSHRAFTDTARMRLMLHVVIRYGLQIKSQRNATTRKWLTQCNIPARVPYRAGRLAGLRHRHNQRSPQPRQRHHPQLPITTQPESAAQSPRACPYRPSRAHARATAHLHAAESHENEHAAQSARPRRH